TQFQPEEKASRRTLPIGNISEVTMQGRVECVAFLPVGCNDCSHSIATLWRDQLFANQPLAETIAVQIGSLFQAHEIRHQLFRRREVTETKSWRAVLGERAVVDPWRLLEQAAHRRAIADIVVQIAVSIVLEKGNGCIIAGLRQRDTF